MKNQRNHGRHHVGLILALVGLIGAATVLLSPARLASAQAVAPRWSYTGNLNKARDPHTATLLPHGQVLVTGGVVDAIGGDREGVEEAERGELGRSRNI